MVKVKICGITRLDDALASAAAGADYLGFVFHEASPRYIPPARAAGIVRALPGRVVPVGVFVDADADTVRATVEASGVRMLQFSGSESPVRCRTAALPVIKAFRLVAGRTAPSDPASYQVYARLADGGGPGSFGGTGMPPDEGMARQLASLGRFILAGGLRPATVAALIRTFRPFAVDVSTGVELSPGVKDPVLVRSFCDAARAAHSRPP